MERKQSLGSRSAWEKDSVKGGRQDAGSKVAEAKAADVEATLAAGRATVQKLMQYVHRVLNVELFEFFDEHAHHFDQDLEELASGRGESLEQYDVFREYERLIAAKLDAFVQEEGYASVDEVFRLVDTACREDKKRAEEQMQRMMAQMQAFRALMAAQMQAQAESQGTDTGNSSAAKLDDQDGHVAADAKCSENPLAEPAPRRRSKMAWGEEDDDEKRGEAKDDALTEAKAPGQGRVPVAKGVELPFFVFKPTTLEDLVSSVLNVAKYETFSRLMRTRAASTSFYRRMMDSERSAPAERAQRSQALEGPPRKLVILAQLEAVRGRILGLLPQFEVGGLRKDVADHLSDAVFSAAVEGDGAMLLVLLQQVAQKLIYFGGPFSAAEMADTVNRYRARLGLPETKMTPLQLLFGATRHAMDAAEKHDERLVASAKEEEAPRPRNLSDQEARGFCRDLLTYAHANLDKVEDRTIQMLRVQQSMQQEMLRRMREELAKKAPAGAVRAALDADGKSGAKRVDSEQASAATDKA